MAPMPPPTSSTVAPSMPSAVIASMSALVVASGPCFRYRSRSLRASRSEKTFVQPQVQGSGSAMRATLHRARSLATDGELVGARGFEPPTTSPPDWCATRLRHAPTRRQVYPARANARQVPSDLVLGRDRCGPLGLLLALPPLRQLPAEGDLEGR